MNSLNDALVYHWPFPLKHKKPSVLKKETAYRLGVKLPNELDLEIKALSKKSQQNLLKGKSFPRSTFNHKVTESRSIIDNFNAQSSLKHRHSGRALGAVPTHNAGTATRKSKQDDALTSGNDGSSDDCRLNLAQLRALFPSSTIASTSKTPTTTKLTQCDSPTFCPMNPYRMVYNSTLSSAHLLLNLKRQQELIDRLNSSHQLKHQLTNLAVTSKRHDSDMTKSEMTLNYSSSHSNRHLDMPSALRNLSHTDRTAVNQHSPPLLHPTLPQALGWRSKSEVLQLPEVDSTLNTTASIATVNVGHQESPSQTHIPRPTRRVACKHHKKIEPAKYADPWKGGGRLYRKRLTDLATMVTETLIWEKSKQYKKTKGSSTTLFSNN